MNVRNAEFSSFRNLIDPKSYDSTVKKNKTHSRQKVSQQHFSEVKTLEIFPLLPISHPFPLEQGENLYIKMEKKGSISCIIFA